MYPAGFVLWCGHAREHTVTKPTILLVAPLGSGGSATNVIGGNRLMAEECVRSLRGYGFGFETVDTSGSVTNLPRWRLRLASGARLVRVLWRTLRRVRRARIALLVSSPYAMPVLATALWLVCKAARRPLVLRISGGDFSRLQRRRGWALARRTYMRCPRVYVETQQLRRDFQRFENVRWFPNTRDIPPPPAQRDGLRRIAFLARLRKDKGLPEALAACRQLPAGVRLGVYGPVTSSTDLSAFNGHPRARYEGVLSPAQVPRVLAEHDLLLYPSYYRNEGYPGAVLEAFQCGLPVIAHDCGGVGELVEHGENGLLVPPSPDAIRAAIESLLGDPALFQRLREGARRRGDEFRSGRWYGRMASDLRCLLPEAPRFESVNGA